MGQQQCGPPSEDQLSSSFFVRDSLDENSDAYSIKSFCHAMGVGKHMKIGSSIKLELVWEKLILRTGVDLPIYRNGHYDNKLNKKLDSHQLEMFQQMKAKYRFVINQEDMALVSLAIMDYKGLRDILQVGIPQTLRWSCWKTILLKNNPQYVTQNLYENLIQNKSKQYDIIEKDVKRTLISHFFFIQNEKSFGQEQLTRVLNAIANYAPSLGYCQGMNFLCGLLLMVSSCDESLVFSVFVSILFSSGNLLFFMYNQYLPMLKIMKFFLKELIIQKLPNLQKHLQNVPDEFWATKMLLSMFLYSFKYKDCVRLWDYLIGRGIVKGYPELILSILDQMESKLLNSDEMEIGQMFQSQQSIDVGNIIYMSKTIYRIKKVERQKILKKFLQEKDLDDEVRLLGEKLLTQNNLSEYANEKRME